MRARVALAAALLVLGPAAAQNLPSPSFKAVTLPGGTITAVVGAGVPLEGSATQPTPSNLIDTIPANPARVGWWFFQNQSAASLTVVLDDGADTAGTKSFFVMAPGGVGAQGASMGSADTGPHLGRIRVYGPANSQHALRVQ